MSPSAWSTNLRDDDDDEGDSSASDSELTSTTTTAPRPPPPPRTEAEAILAEAEAQVDPDKPEVFAIDEVQEADIKFVETPWTVARRVAGASKRAREADDERKEEEEIKKKPMPSSKFRPATVAAPPASKKPSKSTLPPLEKASEKQSDVSKSHWSTTKPSLPSKETPKLKSPPQAIAQSEKKRAEPSNAAKELVKEVKKAVVYPDKAPKTPEKPQVASEVAPKPSLPLLSTFKKALPNATVSSSPSPDQPKTRRPPATSKRVVSNLATAQKYVTTHEKVIEAVEKVVRREEEVQQASSESTSSFATGSVFSRNAQKSSSTNYSFSSPPQSRTPSPRARQRSPPLKLRRFLNPSTPKQPTKIQVFSAHQPSSPSPPQVIERPIARPRPRPPPPPRQAAQPTSLIDNTSRVYRSINSSIDNNDTANIFSRPSIVASSPIPAPTLPSRRPLPSLPPSPRYSPYSPSTPSNSHPPPQSQPHWTTLPIRSTGSNTTITVGGRKGGRLSLLPTPSRFGSALSTTNSASSVVERFSLPEFAGQGDGVGMLRRRGGGGGGGFRPSESTVEFRKRVEREREEKTEEMDEVGGGGREKIVLGNGRRNGNSSGSVMAGGARRPLTEEEERLKRVYRSLDF